MVVGKRDSDLAGHSYGNLFSRDTSVFVGLDFRRFLINAQVDRLLIEPDKWILYCNEEGIEVEFTGWYIFCKKIYICL